MALPTQPPTDRKCGFMVPRRQLQYYEDIYGHRNYDEEFDRFPDECEEETDSDEKDARVSNAAGGLFKTDAGQPSLRSKHRRKAGSEARRLASPLFSTNVTQTQIPNNNNNDSSRAWQINPTINSRASIPVSPGKKFTQRKFGMFGKTQPDPEPEQETVDFDAFVHSDLENLDDGFQVLGETSDGYSQLSQETEDEEGRGVMPADMRHTTTKAAKGAKAKAQQIEPVLAAKMQTTAADESEGYHADEDTQHHIGDLSQHVKKRGRPTNGTGQMTQSMLKTPAGRHETRASSKRNLRSDAKGPQDAKHQASARAATLQKKAKRKAVGAKVAAGMQSELRRSRGTGHGTARITGKALRGDGNGGGEVEEDGKMYVVISESEVDMGEVEKHW